MVFCGGGGTRGDRTAGPRYPSDGNIGLDDRETLA